MGITYTLYSCELWRGFSAQYIASEFLFYGFLYIVIERPSALPNAMQYALSYNIYSGTDRNAMPFLVARTKSSA